MSSVNCPTCGEMLHTFRLSKRVGDALWCVRCSGPMPKTPAPAVQRITTTTEDLTEPKPRTVWEWVQDFFGLSSLLWVGLVLWTLAASVGWY